MRDSQFEDPQEPELCVICGGTSLDTTREHLEFREICESTASTAKAVITVDKLEDKSLDQVKGLYKRLKEVRQIMLDLNLIIEVYSNDMRDMSHEPK